MKTLSHFDQNVWKYRLMNIATVSFNTTVRQMTEMFQWPKYLSKKLTEVFQWKRSLGPGSLSQNSQKSTLFMTLPTKKPKPKTNFFQCYLEDSLSLLRVWIALQHNRLASYGAAKWNEISSSMRDFKEQYTRTPTCSLLPAC